MQDLINALAWPCLALLLFLVSMGTLINVLAWISLVVLVLLNVGRLFFHRAPHSRGAKLAFWFSLVASIGLAAFFAHPYFTSDSSTFIVTAAVCWCLATYTELQLSPSESREPVHKHRYAYFFYMALALAYIGLLTKSLNPRAMIERYAFSANLWRSSPPPTNRHAFKIMNESDDLSLSQVHRLFALFTSDDQEQEIDGERVEPKVFNLKTKRTAVGRFKYAVAWNTWESCGSNALAGPTGALRSRVPPFVQPTWHVVYARHVPRGGELASI